MKCPECTPWLDYWVPLQVEHGDAGKKAVHESLKDDYDFSDPSSVDRFLAMHVLCDDDVGERE